MKITLNKNYVGLLSVVSEQVQPELFKFSLSAAVVEGAHPHEEPPKPSGMVLWDVLCVNRTWSSYNGKEFVVIDDSLEQKMAFCLQGKEKDKDITN